MDGPEAKFVKTTANEAVPSLPTSSLRPCAKYLMQKLTRTYAQEYRRERDE